MAETAPVREGRENETPAPSCYFDGTLWEGVRNAARRYPSLIAFDFMGKTTSYAAFEGNVSRCANALREMGVRPGERVLICLPNCPQAVETFYAVNAVGAVAVMVHPLSGEQEIGFYLRDSGSAVAVTLDQFYGKFAAVWKDTPLRRLVVTSVADGLPPLKAFGYGLTAGRKIAKIPESESVLLWNSFLRNGTCEEICRAGKTDGPAVILYSGGTTGTPKGVLLSNGNFNALAQQIVATNPSFRAGDRMLAVMPVFHGFGLGVCVHSMLFNGGRCLLVPRFTVKSYANLLKKSRCNFIAGVPTLYEALLREPSVRKADLSSLKGVYSGGDTLSVGLKKRLDAFLFAHGSPVPVREGYGTTECVTASCLTPPDRYKEGSIGIPFPDTFYKIVRPGTEEELPFGEGGEICLSGPTVMLGYWNRPEETAQTLRTHADGKVWVHTGDLGAMDEEGFVYFRQRLKRVIVTKGYNVYPSRIENALEALPQVAQACVIGLPDPIRGQRVKAFVVPTAGISPSEETRGTLLSALEKAVAKYALPKEIEFRTELPKTSVGKVAYRVLEEEEMKKESGL